MKEECVSKKCRKIVDTAKQLFWKHGIRRVSIEEICKEAGVSKMTFYHYFSNKSAVAKSILNELMEASINQFNEITTSNQPFPDKVSKLIELKLTNTKNISIEFIRDIYQNPTLGLMEYMEEQKEINLQLFVEFLKKAQKDGCIRRDIKTAFIIAYLNQTFELFNNETLLGHYNNPQDLIMELTNFMFYGLMPSNPSAS